MIRVWPEGAYVFDGHKPVPASEVERQNSSYRDADGVFLSAERRVVAAERTMAMGILRAHDRSENSANETVFRLRFDSLASHDITYVGIIQTLRAAVPDICSFPMPYVLSNCHNSLCAVGGTINADDHAFGLSAAKKYGGIFVPAHAAVIHQYMRERMAGCGRMILGSDSHTRYGALGCMGIGEGGGELVKQLLNRTYDLNRPGVIGVYLTGEPRPGVGPQDVALALIGAVFESGYVKNSILEFFGSGIKGLSMDFRNGIDVMTTETACLSSIWATDDTVAEYYAAHGREADYHPMKPGEGAYYDGLIAVDLSAVKPMIALPFHPSCVCAIEDLTRDAIAGLTNSATKEPAAGFADGLADFSPEHIWNADGKLLFKQGVIAGCAGGLYENVQAAAAILDHGGLENGPFALHVYPASQPVFLALTDNGITARLTRAGAVVKTAFCGPCFGAGDIPPHEGLSARHVTRNFPNREGSKPGAGQRAGVALMDARSIAATAINGGVLTAASDAYTEQRKTSYFFDGTVYEKRVYDGVGHANNTEKLVLGPGIRDWPVMTALPEHGLLTVAAFITDPVTTTDELIPSGETSSYRSNPVALAEFALSRKDPGYVARAKAMAAREHRRRSGEDLRQLKDEGVHHANDEPLHRRRDEDAFLHALASIARISEVDWRTVGLSSLVYAIKPGDGSAREQAASCQRVLGGLANIAREYATKRYRSNLINWGLLPFVLPEEPPFALADYIFIPGLREAVQRRSAHITAYVLPQSDTATVSSAPVPFTITLPGLTADEADIILCGGLINYYRRP